MRIPAMMQSLRLIASLKLTLVALLFFGCGILYAYQGRSHLTLALVLPLLLLSLNLLAAMFTNEVFRQSRSLLFFHLALLGIVILIAAGRLTYLKGHVELAEGEEFAGQFSEMEIGPLHWSGLSQVHFSNEGFSIDYAPGLRRDRTRNKVHFIDDDGREQTAEIGDQLPLVLHGYRFYTSPNKGFAPTFLWTPAKGGESLLGAVHLPSYPMNEYRQAQKWLLPGTNVNVWIMLQFDEQILDPEKQTAFRLPDQHKLIVRIGEMRRELKPGESLELPEGRLTYQGLRTWMGYTVFYDWTIHWLLVTCLAAVGTLGWYFWNKFSNHPWDKNAS